MTPTVTESLQVGMPGNATPVVTMEKPSAIPTTLFPDSAYVTDPTVARNVTIYTDKDVYSLGEDVTFGIKNIGNRDYSFGSSEPWSLEIFENGTWVTIFSAGGVQAFEQFPPGAKRERKWDTGAIPGSSIPLEVKPGRYRVNFGVESGQLMGESLSKEFVLTGTGAKVAWIPNYQSGIRVFTDMNEICAGDPLVITLENGGDQSIDVWSDGPKWLEIDLGGYWGKIYSDENTPALTIQPGKSSKWTLNLTDLNLMEYYTDTPGTRPFTIRPGTYRIVFFGWFDKPGYKDMHVATEFTVNKC
jgi:hypothetical protein